MLSNRVPTSLLEKMLAYTRLVRADKPVGAALLLWPMLWALWFVSDGHPSLAVALVFIVGTFLMRSAGCAINDYADRDIDGSVERTNMRPIVAGLVSPKEAIVVALVLSLVSFLLVLTMNRLTILLSFVAVALAFIYPFTKRVTHWPQLVLGLAFGWAVPMVSAAQTGSVTPLAWVIYLLAILWALAYDTIYAMVDRPDDLKIGVKSTAILFGDKEVTIVMTLQFFILLSIAGIGWLHGLGVIFILGLLAAFATMLFQWKLISGRDRDHCFTAFRINNLTGAFIFAGIALDYLF